jgi:predicted ATP-grasp superfamily ATP-dependent carboligase
MAASRIIIIGASARAAAQSAIRAGYEPWCIDLFGDRDLRAIAAVRTCPADQYPVGVLPMLDDAPDAPVLLTGAMENHDQVVEAIALQRTLLGSNPQAIRAARDPQSLADIEPQGELRTCRVLAGNSLVARGRKALAIRLFPRKYLSKPLRSAAGAGIRRPQLDDALDSDRYLQQRIEGTPVSAVFASDGWSCRLVGATRQIIGDEAFGAGGYRYAGSLGPLDLSPPQRQALSHLGVVLTQRCDLRGVFGADLVMDRKGRLWPVEVNPRYTASIEVIERTTGVAALAARPGTAPAPAPARRAAGKAILFARADCTVPDLYALFDQDHIADVPEAGARIRLGQPICTLLAQAPTIQACEERLHEQARRLYSELGHDEAPAARR